MRLIAIIALLALSLMPCIAEPESIITGSYNISFDLGLPKDAYTIDVKDPKETESLSGEKEIVYSLGIQSESDSDQLAAFSMTEYVEKQPAASASPSKMEEAMETLFPSSARIASRNIDGKNGVIAEYSAKDMTVYTILYYPNAYLLATMMSTYPWDEGTLSMIKTIHVEKINETS